MAMRPKSTRRDLPPRMLARSRTLKSGKVWESFYYNGRDAEGRRVEIPLGGDLVEAKRKWAELEGKKAPIDVSLMKFVFNRYERDIIPLKAPKTQKDNLGSLAMLRKVFDTAPIDAITPQFVAQYRDKRSIKARVRANREISLFSHIWNMAREWGYTGKENPTKGVRKNREKPRDYYADDAVWNAVYGQGCDELKDAMDLSLDSGQRPADVLKFRFTDIRDGALELQQNKTKKKLRILLETNGVRNHLARTIDRIRGRKVTSFFLVATPDGRPLNRWTLRIRFDHARKAAADAATADGQLEFAARIKAFQFRDIRPKAASEVTSEHASRLLGHSPGEITDKVYRRRGEVVEPTR